MCICASAGCINEYVRVYLSMARAALSDSSSFTPPTPQCRSRYTAACAANAARGFSEAASPAGVQSLVQPHSASALGS